MYKRQVTGIAEFDRVLGGGIVRGSLVLVGGDPGIGKSTLLLQVCRELSKKKVPLLYVSGEESLHQIKMRADRLGDFTDSLELLCETSLDIAKDVIQRKKPEVVVIDSIQTMYNEEIALSLIHICLVQCQGYFKRQGIYGLDYQYIHKSDIQ